MLNSISRIFTSASNCFCMVCILEFCKSINVSILEQWDLSAVANCSSASLLSSRSWKMEAFFRSIWRSQVCRSDSKAAEISLVLAVLNWHGKRGHRCYGKKRWIVSDWFKRTEGKQVNIDPSPTLFHDFPPFGPNFNEIKSRVPFLGLLSELWLFANRWDYSRNEYRLPTVRHW